MGPRATHYLHLNAWLAERGLLEARRRGSLWRGALSRLTNFLIENLPIRQELRRWFPQWVKARATAAMLNVGSINWSRTSAYRVRMLAPVEGIEINLKGRQPRGTVDPSDYEELRDHILEQLPTITDPSNGERLVSRAFRREELYHGPSIGRAPDIVLEMKADYEGGVSAHSPVISPIPRSFLKMRSGNHTMDGIFIARGPQVNSRAEIADAHLADVTPTILYYLGIPVPENMDGRVLKEIFQADLVDGRGVERGPAVVATEAADGGVSAEDEEAMRQQLRGLGYL